MRIDCSQEELFEFLCTLNEDNKRFPRDFTQQKFKFVDLDAKISQASVGTEAVIMPSARFLEKQAKRGIYSQIVDYIISSGTDLQRNYFSQQDPANSGKVTIQQFIVILQQLTSGTTDVSQVRDLANDWVENGTDVYYQKFINHINDFVSAKRESRPLLNRIYQQSTGMNLEAIFRQKDPSNTEHMKTFDIEEILKQNRIIVTSEEFIKLGRFIPKDPEGKLNYVELCKCIAGATTA